MTLYLLNNNILEVLSVKNKIKEINDKIKHLRDEAKMHGCQADDLVKEAEMLEASLAEWQKDQQIENNKNFEAKLEFLEVLDLLADNAENMDMDEIKVILCELLTYDYSFKKKKIVPTLLFIASYLETGGDPASMVECIYERSEITVSVSGIRQRIARMNDKRNFNLLVANGTL